MPGNRAYRQTQCHIRWREGAVVGKPAGLTGTPVVDVQVFSSGIQVSQYRVSSEFKQTVTANPVSRAGYVTDAAWPYLSASYEKRH